MEIRKIVRDYILKNFISDQDADRLQDDMQLFRTGFIDSVGTIKLVSYLEQRFKIDFQPRELNRARFETIEDISRLVETKIEKTGLEKF